MKITEVALKHKITVFAGLLIIVLMGINAYTTLPRESAPDIPIPIFLVVTVYPGVSPADMEKLVTVHLEKKIKELSDIEELTSTSGEGVSIVRVEFSPDIDLDQAFQRVREKIDLAKPDLPKEAEDPVLTEVNVSEFPIAIVTFTGDASLQKMKEIAETLKDNIEIIPGILAADIAGNLEREIQVRVDLERLLAYRLSLSDVMHAIQTENVNIPGGTIDIESMKFMVRVPGEFEKPEQIKDIVIKAEHGTPIFIRDIATVHDSFKDRTTYARFNGMKSVTLTVRKRAGENAIRIVDEIKTLLKEERKRLPENVAIELTFDESKDIKMMVDELENSVMTGIVLIVVVLLFFMGFRNSFYVSLAIPFSMLLTFIVVQAVGYTMNMMVLFSLILAVGMLVDNAIVIVENIYRHMQEGMSNYDAALQGTSEVGWPVIASTATTIGAFFPLVFWPDIIGKFMSYLPKTVIIVLIASMLVAFVINPVFCALFMHVKKDKKGNVDDHRKKPLIQAYGSVLVAALKHRFLTMTFCFVLLVLIIVLYGKYGHGVEFFPETDPNRVYVDITYPEGTNLDTSNNTVKRIEAILEKKEDVKYVITSVGSQSDAASSALLGSDAGSPNLSRVMIEFYDFEERKRPSTKVIEEIRREIDALQIAGAVIKIEKEAHGPPTDAPVKIEISGDDYDKLGEIADNIKRKIHNTPGLVDLDDDYEAGRPEFKIRIDREKAARLKLNTHLIATTIRTAINGTEISKFREDDEEYDITVRLEESFRENFEDILTLAVSNEDGDTIYLSEIAQIVHDAGWGSIARKNKRRTVSVTANNSEGVNANELLAQVREQLKDFQLPPGYLVRFTGQQEEQNENQDFLSKAFGLAILLIWFVLVTEFNSVTMPIVILTSVILSLFGVFAGLLITGQSFGIIMTGVGVISLAGVVVNNAIVLIDYIRQLRERGMKRYDAIIQAGKTRFRPVILTAITTIAGLIPLTTGYGFDFKRLKFITGTEMSQFWSPMGSAVIFGLAFATVLTLIVVPVMYSYVDDFETWVRRLFSRKK